jgi:hypothetical protein
MTALALAAALAVAPHADAGPRLPGLALRLGESLAAIDSSGAWRVEPASGPGRALRSGVARFFGMEAGVRLRFVEGRLARVEARIDQPSPHQRGYVGDQLRRMGLRRECAEDAPGRSVCTWTGRARVVIESTPEALDATLDAPPAPAADPGASAPAPPDTLDLAGGTVREGFAAPRVVRACDALQEARGAGAELVTVGVTVLVDTSGTVVAARADDHPSWVASRDPASGAAAYRWAPPPLGSLDWPREAMPGAAADSAAAIPGPSLNRFERAALDCAVRTRFEPPRHAGRAVVCRTRLDARVPLDIAENP